MNDLCVIILAAGVGKRFRSSLPKVLHPICGKPMVWYVVDVAKKLNCKIIMVVSEPKDKFEKIFQDIDFVVQPIPRGTGDAVLCTEEYLNDFNGSILVLCGDTPLISFDTLNKLIDFHKKNEAALTVLTAYVDDPTSYGRIIRKEDRIYEIIEDSDAKEEQKKIKEINSGIYVFKKEPLFNALHKIKPDNAQLEYYLTSTIKILFNEGYKVCPFMIDDETEIIGINDRKKLTEVECIIQARIIERHQMNGVTIKNVNNTIIEADVKIGRDTIIYSGAQLLGKTDIGENCIIGANCIIKDSKISSNTQIEENTTIYGSIV